MSADTPKNIAFSWFPGHMRKALRQLEATLDLADLVMLVLDARIPLSSRQPEIEQMLRRKNKEIILVLNKADLADEKETAAWLSYLRGEKLTCVSMRSISGRGPGALEQFIAVARKKVNQKRLKKGLLARDPRLVVAGIPNVGKSSLLNRLAGGAGRAKTGAKPGVTRGNQWVAVPGKWQILDSPGILYPRIDGEYTLTSLAAVSCIKHDVIPLERVGGLLMSRLLTLGKAKKLLSGLHEDVSPEECLNFLADKNKWYISSGEPDLSRTARFILQACAQGDLGPATLELCPYKHSVPDNIRETVEHPREQRALSLENTADN